MRRALLSGLLIAGAAAFVLLATGASGPSGTTYRIELQNAFGLVPQADFEVAGVPAGTIQSIGLDQRTLDAIVTVQVTRSGFGQFHADATCASRPESLIGEYYVDCDPGTSGPVLRSGSTIPVTHTTSTIPADLVMDIMRLPYRERFTLIVNELGAAVASRSGDLQSALARADPALSEADALLALLARDSATLRALTRDSDTVISALAGNSGNVVRFVEQAGRTAAATATQQASLRTTLARLPALLEQLRPTMAQLGTTLSTNEPVLSNLYQSAGRLHRLLADLPAFSRSATPAIASLGRASVTGRAAVTAATPTVRDLNEFAAATPQLARNLAIVLRDLDDPSRAVEPDPRSPGGRGFTGLQALLGYVFNQALAINTFGPEGHMLAVDAFFSPMCSPYATPATVALALKQYGPAYRQCYSWLGPSQPGVNEPDPSNPGAAVPDPGGAPAGQRGPSTRASRLTAAMVDQGTGPGSTGASANAPGNAPGAPARGQATPAGWQAAPAAAPSAGYRPGSAGAPATLLNYLLAP